MKISVVIPTYNRAYTLKRCIDSVLKQSYKPLEIIVIDDGSTDETLEILKSYSDNISYYVRENHGVSAARNFGVQKSRGDWLAFLDSDDEWLPKRLELQVELAQKQKDFALIHGEEIWIRNGKRVNQRKIHQKSGGFIYQKCLPLCLISPSASLIKKEVYNSLGGFDESFPVCEDYDLWLKLTSRYEVGFIKEPIINKYGGHEDQLSRKYFAMDLWRIRSMVKMLEVPLEDDDRLATRKEIERKAKILILGYKKHNNLKDLPEVESHLKNLKLTEL